MCGCWRASRARASRVHVRADAVILTLNHRRVHTAIVATAREVPVAFLFDSVASDNYIVLILVRRRKAAAAD